MWSPLQIVRLELSILGLTVMFIILITIILFSLEKSESSVTENACKAAEGKCVKKKKKCPKNHQLNKDISCPDKNSKCCTPKGKYKKRM